LKKKILIISGGYSKERQISIQTGNQVAKELKIDPEPRLNSNQSDKDYQKVQKFSDLKDDFKSWHRSYNSYDYMLYEEFCK